MIVLPKSEYVRRFLEAGGKRHWWGYPRGFQWNNEIYINKDARYIGSRDYNLVVAHEEGHLKSKPHTPTLTEQILGDDHTLMGLMCPWGPIRYLTTPGQF